MADLTIPQMVDTYRVTYAEKSDHIKAMKANKREPTSVKLAEHRLAEFRVTGEFLAALAPHEAEVRAMIARGVSK